MTKYLFTTLPSNDLGLLTRSLPIARELRNRGHQIAFCNPAKAPSKLISDAGFDNLVPPQPLYYFLARGMSFESLSGLLRSRHLKRDAGTLFACMRSMHRTSTAEIWNIDHFLNFLGFWNEDLVRAGVEALMEVISAYEPDVVVDFWNPFACVAAKASRKPLISVMQAEQHAQSRGFIWWKEVPPEFQAFPVDPTNTILAEHGLQPVRRTSEVLIGDMTLVMGLPETDPLPPTANVTYIGPILWEREGEQLPQWIADLGAKRPVIWLYPGNVQYHRGKRVAYDSAVVLQSCLEALANEPVQVVLTTGHHELPRKFRSLPDNFRHEPFVPGLAMAQRSDLLIHHGGYGSCQTGLYTGTPALIIPTYSERESNARRVAAQGAGDYVLPKTDVTGREKQVSADEVRAKVFKILSQPSFKQNAKRIGEKMKSYGGAIEAARLIECSTPVASGAISL